MITKISETGSITCEAYGFSPGTYPLSEFTADDLLEERRILHTYCQAHQITGDVFRKLDDQIARAIDDKCNKSMRKYLGYSTPNDTAKTPLKLTTSTTVIEENIEEKHSDKELLEMQEIATNFIWHVKPNNILKGIIEIALIEINRELDMRKLRNAGMLPRKEAAGG